MNYLKNLQAAQQQQQQQPQADSNNEQIQQSSENKQENQQKISEQVQQQSQQQQFFHQDNQDENKEDKGGSKTSKTQNKQQKFKDQFTSPQVTYDGSKYLGIQGQNQQFKLEMEGIDEKEDQTFIIAICGGISSGKRQLARLFEKSLIQNNQSSALVKLSDFYIPMPKNLNPEEQQKWKKDTDFDHPDSIDWELLIKALKSLQQQQSFDAPVYDKKNSQRKSITKRLDSSDIIIVEGTLSFYNQELLQMYNLKIFLDTDEDLRLSRRVYYDCLKLNKNVEDVLERYEKQIKPDFEKFVKRYKKFADIIIPNYGGYFIKDNNQLNMPLEFVIESEDIQEGKAQLLTESLQEQNAAVDLILNQIKKKKSKLGQKRLNFLK